MRRTTIARWPLLAASVLALAAACSSGDGSTPPAVEEAPTPSSSPAPERTAAPPPADTAQAPTQGAPAEPPPDQEARGLALRAGIPVFEWPKTDFSKASVPFDAFLGGGPPKDGIPAIDNPVFETVAQADDWIEDREPLQLVEIDGDARAYPLQVMIWHEIVNDTVGGVPIAINY